MKRIGVRSVVSQDVWQESVDALTISLGTDRCEDGDLTDLAESMSGDRSVPSSYSLSAYG